MKAHDGAGNVSAYVSPAATFVITDTKAGDIFLPVIIKAFAPGPDLVIDDLVATSSQVTVTIRNAGTETATNDFWLDVYFNPSTIPVLNEPWEAIAPAGAVWGVTKSLAPGESLVLTTGGDYYFGPPDSSATFPVGANVYGYIDVINHSTSYGNVKEGNEGNNLAGPVTSTAGVAGLEITVTGSASKEGLPVR